MNVSVRMLPVATIAACLGLAATAAASPQTARRPQFKRAELKDTPVKAGETPGSAGDATEAGSKGATAGAADLSKRSEEERQKHLLRMAKIERLLTLAKDSKKADLASKAEVLKAKEEKRHEMKMAKITAGPAQAEEKDSADKRSPKRQKNKGAKGKGKGGNGKGKRGER